ncbi:MAG: PAS domain S-box protein [Desulfobulbaceae bacterium]|nr:PAS domain S-box protein [Desulfobulbaceae bacterium]
MAAQPTYEELRQRLEQLEQEAAARQETMAILEENVNRYSTLVDEAHDLIHSVTPDGAFLYVNRAWRQALGYSDEDLKNLSLMDIVDKSCREKCRAIFDSLINGKKIDRNETIFVAKDGRRITVEGQCSTKFKDGKPVTMAGFFRDITDRVQNEKALRESEKRYRNLFENAHDLIQIVQPDGALLYVNRAWRQTFGYSKEETRNLSIFELISPECQEHCKKTFAQVLSEEKVNYIDTTFLAKDGRSILIEGNAICKFQDNTPLYTQCIFRDVTEKRKLEEELLKAQKLESVGVFAGGIAHDFNNLLTAVLGNISMAKLYLNPQDRALIHLNDTEKATQRARSLTQQLLTFSKGGAPIKKKTTITELILDSSSFPLRGSNIKCRFNLADDLRAIEVDEGQLSQVIQNLVINGAQAMPDGGTITVSSKNIHLTEQELPPLPAGQYVRITVADHGIGIPIKDQNKIFDPYFSSKETGNGLGLAICYSIIQKHDGLITVSSKPGHGATFSIFLPAVSAMPQKKEANTAAHQIRGGKILIMDDEEMVQRIACDMLKHLGCETEVARDGREAIDLYRKALMAGKPFEAVLMDLTIRGGVGGKETIERLIAIDPTVKAVVSSGYANDPIMADFRKYGFCAVAPKPYNLKELRAALSNILVREMA